MRNLSPSNAQIISVFLLFFSYFNTVFGWLFYLFKGQWFNHESLLWLSEDPSCEKRLKNLTFSSVVNFFRSCHHVLSFKIPFKHSSISSHIKMSKKIHAHTTSMGACGTLKASVLFYFNYIAMFIVSLVLVIVRLLDLLIRLCVCVFFYYNLAGIKLSPRNMINHS